jgi:glutaconyl-CoA/methylmalonyl-CoA decarboxylase subunit gamma
MKKLQITVNGVSFIVDVEVLQDDESQSLHQQYVGPVDKFANTPNQHISSSHLNTLVHKQPAAVKKKIKHDSSDSKLFNSPINGVVLEVLYREGDIVNENDVVIVLESMKMKTNISSPREGRIKSIRINVGDMVELGQLLLEFED